MRIVVTGGAGFIGSHVVDMLMAWGHEVVVLDNLSTGTEANIKYHIGNPRFAFEKIDLVFDKLNHCFEGADEVWHLAGSCDVRMGESDTCRDLYNNVLATHNVLDAMRLNKVKRMVFTSTGAVYGDGSQYYSTEDDVLRPISLYAASKVACEALIAAYSHTFGIDAWIYRLGNVVGPRSSHGVIFDFIKRLMDNPNELVVLGDGMQTKTYVHVHECVGAMAMGLRTEEGGHLHIFNVGTKDTVSVTRIAALVAEAMGVNPSIVYTGGSRGWKGDVPYMALSSEKLDWHGMDSEAAVKRAISDMYNNLQ